MDDSKQIREDGNNNNSDGKSTKKNCMPITIVLCTVCSELLLTNSSPPLFSIPTVLDQDDVIFLDLSGTEQRGIGIEYELDPLLQVSPH